MRLWLGASFALVGTLTAVAVYLFVINSSQDVLSRGSKELAIGRTSRLADRVGAEKGDPTEIVLAARGEGFLAWYFDEDGRLAAPTKPGPTLIGLKGRRRAVAQSLDGGRYNADEHDGKVTIVSVPVFRDGQITGAVLGRFSRPVVIRGAISHLESDSLRALIIAVALGTLVGFLIASGIAIRVKRLARSAGEMASGTFDVDLDTDGRDEIGDLARALESMRTSLKESFGVLTADRDKLTAIFDGLGDAVMVVDHGGTMRFSNAAAAQLLGPAGVPPEAMLSQLNRAAREGFAAHPALRIGDHAYSMQARSLPDENAVLAVVRDRTEEMRKEFAERDFVSNAAHELRNPLAGIASAIEVLRSGAKDDPQARDHFLDRLAADAERMSRLTQALLTLARVEALGAGEVEVVDVKAAAEDVAEAVEVPPGLELGIDVEPDLTAKGDPTLLRQVLIGLVTNALKNTPPPGSVTVRGRRSGGTDMLLEVIDTGTGIPKAELGRVFERFYRRSETRKQEGFGLGLAIARRMADVMGGEMGVHSVEGRGSTFWVLLPLANPSLTPIA